MKEQNNILNSALFEHLDIFIKIVDNFDFNSNKKHLFFFKSSDNEFLALLSDIIKATKLPETEYELIEVADSKKINLGLIFFSKTCESSLFFGFTSEELGIPSFFKNYHAFRLRDKNLLLAESLQLLNTNQTSKKKLWSQLKLILNIV